MNSKQLRSDIRWTVDSPSLLTSPLCSLKLCRDAELIPTLDMCPEFSPTVGRYFECIVNGLLHSENGVEILEHSLQIFDNDRTIGELDFIYRRPSGLITHLEVAVKFYLYYENKIDKQCYFIGPNPTDTFENKIQRLLQHQLPLSQKAYPAVNDRQAFMKGSIFYPPNAKAKKRLPRNLNPAHSRGTWIFANNLAYYDMFPNDVFAICEKPHWLAFPLDESRYQSHTQIRQIVIERFRRQCRPLMLSRLKKEDGYYIEQERLFVVPEGWPNLN
ncbi:MAG: hypothetical protein CMJ76_10850 [Planctomycetaceae bacterium]|nr:hypothetical protein [Planctomycetaceae bacterium]